MEQFYGDDRSQDRVVLVEDPLDAGVARVNLIANAEDTLDITYHVLHAGKASDVFFSSIIDAADRGVKVRILLDGMFHNLRGSMKDVLYAFTFHNNIELKFYEPIDALRPWTLNNRLHDKLIISDKEYAVIGGRNIGDKYFAPEGFEGASNDRDVIIINTDLHSINGSVVNDMKEYFDKVWEHEYTKTPLTQLSYKQKGVAQDSLDTFRLLFNTFFLDHPEFLQNDLDWLDQSVPTNKITFIHNPIERMNKEPWVWYELTNLMEHAEQSILIQSPYIIPTKNMTKHLNTSNISANDITILTNSLSATSNVIAYSGYKRYREKIAGSIANLYEYQNSTNQLHTKSFLFDNQISVIGSFNLDPRSTFLSTESMVVIDSEELADLLIQEVEAVIERQSLLVNYDGTYVYNPLVEEEKVPFKKAIITKILSIPVRLVENML
ncbi:phospholipase D-like domain-containing protein [Alkalihalobacterium elongatum]|uniref:phospholipase D-like domain-containing protein n=1 Tax=Alkalihalobacterium elongatum TaxID=2675466 RepID=UPI001C1F98B7|nr:phospholipase D family protein [Alkalihalobacterium elongatum]